MATYTRTTKATGTTEWQDNAVIDDDEHNAEWNQFVTEYNGNIDNDNIAKTGGKLIASDKINHYSATEVEQLATTSPGTTFGLTPATDLQKELEGLRYRILQNLVGDNFQAWDKDASDFADMGWMEPKVVGPNILPNSGFEVQSGVANSAPDGWTKVGSPAISIEAASDYEMGTHKRSLKIVAAGAGFEGVRYVAQGLKADTKYLVGAAYTVSSDGFALTTTGALSTSFDYGNVSFVDSTGTALEVRNFAIQTNSLVTGDVTVSFGVTGNIGADANIYQVWMREMNEAAPYETPTIPIQTVTDSTQVEYSNSSGPSWVDTDYTGLNLSVFVPAPGYVLTYEADLTATYQIQDETAANDAWESTVDLQMEAGSGNGYNSVFLTGMDGTWEATPTSTESFRASAHPRLRHVVSDPEPGLLYSFKIVVGVYNENVTTNTVTINPVSIGARQTQSRAELELRRI